MMMMMLLLLRLSKITSLPCEGFVTRLAAMCRAGVQGHAGDRCRASHGFGSLWKDFPNRPLPQLVYRKRVATN